MSPDTSAAKPQPNSELAEKPSGKGEAQRKGLLRELTSEKLARLRKAAKEHPEVAGGPAPLRPYQR